jgi:hypothetical protein
MSAADASKTYGGSSGRSRSSTTTRGADPGGDTTYAALVARRHTVRGASSVTRRV